MNDTETLVIDDIRKRQELGIKKYGTTLANNPLSKQQWRQHLYEELLDAVLYLKREGQQEAADACKTCQNFTQGKNPLVGTYDADCFECCHYYGDKWVGREAGK